MLPVIIELKHFSPPGTLKSDEKSGHWAMLQLRQSVTKVQGFGMTEMFDAFMVGDGVLVLLDGLDEVATERYAGVARTIRALSDFLANQSEKNAVVLTMRSQFHHQIRKDFDDAFPELLYIEPFSAADIYAFLTRWPYRESSDEQVARIYSELTDRPTLRDMCRNPLVLAMYVAEDQSTGESSNPDVRTAFYDQVVRELFIERRSRQRQTAAHTPLLRQREEIFGRLAYDNITDETQDLNSILRVAAVAKVADARKLTSTADADRELDLLVKDTGIVDEERPGQTLRFIHLSFGEFLAAKYAALRQKGGWDELLRRHGEMGGSRLIEVLPFALALLPPAEQPDAIDQVAALGDNDLLGRCFLESQAYDHALWPGYVEDERESLLAVSPEHWTENWLQRLRRFTVVARDAEAWGRLSGARIDVAIGNMFSDLVGTDRERLSRVFSSFASHDPAAAFRLAEATGVDLVSDQPALVLRNTSDPPFLATAVHRAIATTPASLRSWAPLLAEAALIQPAVAAYLYARTAPLTALEAAGDLPEARDWISFGRPVGADERGRSRYQLCSATPSCYGAFISIALNRADELAPHYLALRELRNVPAPPRKMSRVPALLAVTGMTLGMTLVFALVVEHALVGWLASTAFDLGVYVCAGITAALVFIPQERARLYRVITNLDAGTALRRRSLLDIARLKMLPRGITRPFLKRLFRSALALQELRVRDSGGGVTVQGPAGGGSAEQGVNGKAVGTH
jgi:hypothetical protein